MEVLSLVIMLIDLGFHYVLVFFVPTCKSLLYVLYQLLEPLESMIQFILLFFVIILEIVLTSRVVAIMKQILWIVHLVP